MRRAGWNDQSQELLQRTILTRQALFDLLRTAKIVAATDSEIRYRLPLSRATAAGPVVQIDDNQLLSYETEVRSLAMHGTRLVETSAVGDRVLWDLGAGGNWTIDLTQKPVVEFRFAGLKNPEDSQSPPWQQSFTLYLRNLP